jgi:ubiquinone/menaquinone biosynthesis C-methylase UbiE
MVNIQEEFWSQVSPTKYELAIDAQLGNNTRSLICEKLGSEGRLGKTVEFGCGTGCMTKVLAGKVDSLVATDIADGMVRVAKENVKGYDNIQFQVANSEKTTFPDMAFDTAFMGLVIHFTDADKTLAEMKRILKPDGTLIIANLDPGLKAPYNMIGVLRAMYHALMKYHRQMPVPPNMMTGSQLSEKLEKAGFKVNSMDMLRDTGRASNFPVDYIKAVKAS